MQHEVKSDTRPRRLSSAHADAVNEVNNFDMAAHALLEGTANLRVQLDWFLAKTAVGEDVYIEIEEETKAPAISDHPLWDISGSINASATQIEDPLNISLASRSTEAWKSGSQ